ncbi:hypothetical protein ACFP9V_22370 [Deinococcus radiopugnans]|uniref:hypothetical protein n=1 Tax=Deinococcus radiopugnans TaxID=57497 RepID=UPI003618A5E2
MLTSDQGEDQEAAMLLPEIVEETRRRLEKQARENRETRRAEQRARFHQLVTAPTDEAAPDFVPPVSLQEGRQPPAAVCASPCPALKSLGLPGAS